MEVDEGGSATLECELPKGRNLYMIKWLKEGKMVRAVQINVEGQDPVAEAVASGNSDNVMPREDRKYIYTAYYARRLYYLILTFRPHRGQSQKRLSSIYFRRTERRRLLRV